MAATLRNRRCEGTAAAGGTAHGGGTHSITLSPLQSHSLSLSPKPPRCKLLCRPRAGAGGATDKLHVGGEGLKMPSIETNNNWMELMASEGLEVIDLEAKYNRLLQYHSLNTKTGDIKRGMFH